MLKIIVETDKASRAIDCDLDYKGLKKEVNRLVKVKGNTFCTIICTGKDDSFHRHNITLLKYWQFDSYKESIKDIYKFIKIVSLLKDIEQCKGEE